MSITPIIPQKPAIFPGSIAAPIGPPLIFDAAVAEDHQRSSQITDNPIESTIAGVGNQLVSDHVQKAPPMIAVELVASRYPDEILPNPIPTRHTRLWLRTERIWQTDQVFDLVTFVKIYTGLMIVSMNLRRTAETTHTYVISLLCKKLQFAGIDAAQQMADAAAEIALGAIDGGIQGTASAAATALIIAEVEDDG